MNVTIEVDDRAVRVWLARLHARVADLRPTMSEIGDALVSSTKLRFRASRGPDGTPWAPLSPVTIALRRKGSSKPLLDTGRLANSITKAASANAVVVGTNTIYARMQQFGAKKGAFGRGKYVKRRGSFAIPWGNVPARPFLGLSREDTSEVLGIIRRRIQEAAE